MFSFDLLRPGSFRRHFMRGVFALFCLFTVILFTGCDLEPNNFIDDHQLNSNLIGTWRDYYEGTSYDDYIITAARLDYDSGGIGYGGTIEYVSNFSENAGVIIIKYDTSDFKLADVGKYIGVYYRSLSAGTVEMSTAINDDWSSAATVTKEQAESKFTEGNSGDYVTLWGGPYSKQP